MVAGVDTELRADPGPAVDEERVVHGAGGLCHSARGGHGEPIGRAHDVVFEARARIDLHRYLLAGVAPAPALNRRRTSSELPRSVSKTPGPRSASAANSGPSRKLMASESSLTGRISSVRRSCLQNCTTSGSGLGSTP